MTVYEKGDVDLVRMLVQLFSGVEKDFDRREILSHELQTVLVRFSCWAADRGLKW